uniref:Uncharacterized protein n=1 Tax=Trichuris muris TaxID=70415 RepID=A0A5S6R462_TRIMR
MLPTGRLSVGVLADIFPSVAVNIPQRFNFSLPLSQLASRATRMCMQAGMTLVLAPFDVRTKGARATDPSGRAASRWRTGICVTSVNRSVKSNALPSRVVQKCSHDFLPAPTPTIARCVRSSLLYIRIGQSGRPTRQPIGSRAVINSRCLASRALTVEACKEVKENLGADRPTKGSTAFDAIGRPAVPNRTGSTRRRRTNTA